MERLATFCGQYPVANMLLGDFYIEEENHNAENVKKAAMCYQIADRYGFLDKQQARWLLTYYSQEGIQIDEKERERLEKLAEGSHEMFIPEMDDIEESIDSICVDTVSIMDE
jgi:hypothetical protein